MKLKYAKEYIIWGSCLWVVGAVHAQQEGTEIYSLKTCIEYTLNKNPSTVVYDNQIKIAQRQQQEGLASYLPQVNFTGTFDDNLKRPVTVIPAGAFSPVDLRVQFGNKYATTLTLQADQVIYDQSVIEGIRANKPNIELAKYKKMRNDDDLIYNTAAAYYQVLIYKQQLSLLSENEKKFSDLLKVQQLQFDKGAITKVSLNRVRVNYNNILSQKKVAQTNYALALNRLKNAMGLEIEKDLKIVDSLDYDNITILPNDDNIEVKTG
ncbi:MAG TPA: TolC family protein, partial [Cytophagales bacterium]|nr:TolC family protein [Cytophagales bacterium]